MASVGNAVANAYWEANLPADFERPEPSNRYQMTTFIRQKYVNAKWAGTGPAPGKVAVTEHPIPVPGNGKVRTFESREQSSSSNEDISLQDIFGSEGQKTESIRVPKPVDGVSSATRRPGKKIPERLARKLRMQEGTAIARQGGSVSDDPFG
jgi:hypothetical protein